MVTTTNPIFSDEQLAIKYLESIRWRIYRYCPKCGETERTSPTNSKNHRPGLYYCNSCKSLFTVTIGTVFERMRCRFHGLLQSELHQLLGIASVLLSNRSFYGLFKEIVVEINGVANEYYQSCVPARRPLLSISRRIAARPVSWLMVAAACSNC